MVRVDRRLLLGTQGELEEALFHSEDSSTLNTSFVERHKLTIRQGCSYLGRRTPCHARRTEFLEGHVALLMAYYNFVRPHSALRFGKTMRTPAMQGGPGQKQALIPRGLHKSGGIPFVCFDSDPILRHRGLPSELNNSCLKKRLVATASRSSIARVSIDNRPSCHRPRRPRLERCDPESDPAGPATDDSRGPGSV